MPADLTLTKDDYAVFSRIPLEWMDENFVGAEIAQALGIKSGVALRRLSRFVAVGIVERRPGRDVREKTEIRRIGNL